MSRRSAVALSTVALALAACTTPSGADAPSSAPGAAVPAGDSEMVEASDRVLTGSWVLASNPDITLEVTEAGEASGNGGCNTYGTTIETDAATGDLAVGPVISTRMACEQDVMDAENAYLTALEAVVSGESGDADLTLTTADGDELVFDAA